MGEGEKVQGDAHTGRDRDTDTGQDKKQANDILTEKKWTCMKLPEGSEFGLPECVLCPHPASIPVRRLAHVVPYSLTRRRLTDS